MQEKIIQTKACKHCESKFDITDKDLEFYKKVSPKFEPSPNLSQRERDNWNNNFLIPTPTLCSDCRQQRRLAFRNERNLYKRKCDATGKLIISIYSPESKHKVYNHDFYWGDNWDPLEYGRDYNFSKKFFTQFHSLFLDVPKRSVMKGSKSENCDYVNFVGESKNCYLIFNAADNEDCSYSNTLIKCEYCLDCSLTRKSQNCYECIDIENCQNCFYTQDSINCSYSSYLSHCKNCTYCYSCINLENKKYCINNKQYSKKEYFKKIKEILSPENHFKKFKFTCPVQSLTIISSENAQGNIIYNSHNILNSFETYDSENIRHSSNIFKSTKDISDVFVAINNCSLLYECHIINKFCSQMLFCSDCWGYQRNMIYCFDSKRCNDCFGCCGLNGKQYCILNKQYTKEEYNILVPKIIEKMRTDGEWGEFFPASLSPFGYNETVAQEYFPINSPFQRGARGGDFNWSTYTPPKPNVEKVIPASKLPENISDIPDDILNWAIECEVTKKPFRIIPQELEFYRKHNIPVPRRHPDQRHLDRMKLRNPRKLFNRDCDKCGVSMQTTYSPDREEIVYCQTCYNKEIY